MKALFVTNFPPENSLPSMEAEAGLQLHYTDDTGILRGGYSCVGQVPQAPTAIVLVEAAPATIAAMKADGRYLWLEDVNAEGTL